VVRSTSAVFPALHAHERVLAQPRGTLVRSLEREAIKRGAHRSVRALETTIREHLAITNEAPKPFVWTKTADEILAKVAGFCQRISNPGH